MFRSYPESKLPQPKFGVGKHSTSGLKGFPTKQSNFFEGRVKRLHQHSERGVDAISSTMNES